MCAPVALGGVAYLLLVWADFAHSLPRGQLGNDPFERDLWLGEAIALGTIAAGVTWPWLRARRTRSPWPGSWSTSAIRRPGGLGEALASTLGDPALDRRPIRSPTPAGTPTATMPRRTRRRETGEPPRLWRAAADDGGAALMDRPVLRAESQLVREVGLRPPASRWRTSGFRPLSAPSLRTCVRPPGRVVAAGDAERRLLERDLHDGGQQRLISLSLALRLAGPGSARTRTAT